MRKLLLIAACLPIVLVNDASAEIREWASADGGYRMKGQLIAFNDSSVVLKDQFEKLVSVELDDLSEADREFVQSRADIDADDLESMQIWTSKAGMKIRGKVVAYGKKQLNVQRQLGKILINDRPFQKLPELRQELVLRILSGLEDQTFDATGLKKWARGLGAQIKSYPLSGVLMELESGDVIGVPFFLFDEQDLKILEPGWNLWLANANDEAARAQEDLIVQTQASEYQRDRQQREQIEIMKLEMMARASGVIKVWQVNLVPINSINYRPIAVMVNANDSATASQIAMQQYPGFRVASVKRSRRWYPT